MPIFSVKYVKIEIGSKTPSRLQHFKPSIKAATL